MDQNKATEHFSDGCGLLPAIDDASVRHASGMKFDEIIVLRYDNTSGRGGELKATHVARADQASFRRRSHFDVSAPKAIRDMA